MWLEEAGIYPTYSVASNAQGDGGAKRAVRTVKGILRTLGLA